MDWNYHTYVLNVQNQGRSLCGFVDWNSSSIPVVAVFISSKPIRFRGLKCFRCMPFTYLNSRSLYGFVDWNSRCTIHIIITRCRSLCGFVDWNNDTYKTIQITRSRGLRSLVDWNFNIHSIYLYNFCRGLCSLVDWNKKTCRMMHGACVEAYVASWIEIIYPHNTLQLQWVEAYAASWIGIWISNDISNLYTI